MPKHPLEIRHHLDNERKDQVVLSLEGDLDGSQDTKDTLEKELASITHEKPRVVMVWASRCSSLQGGMGAWMEAVRKHVPADTLLVYPESQLGMQMYYCEAYTQLRPNDVILDENLAP